MTREEAIAKAYSAVYPPGRAIEFPAGGDPRIAELWERQKITDIVSAVVALGLLKLEDAKKSDRVDSLLELVCSTADFSYGTVSAKVERLQGALDLAGLSIVEKQHGE